MEVAIRPHCHYEIHPGRPNSLVLARPLSRAAKVWMGGRGKEEERISCLRDDEGEVIRKIEASVDVWRATGGNEAGASKDCGAG